MPSAAHSRLPISTRHAFALAFDLAVRRDFVHSMLVPVLLRAPWILAPAFLPAADDSDRPHMVQLLQSLAGLGDFLTFVVVTAMLRFRARSVFNTPAGVHPAPVLECYAQGVGRSGWLFLTEVVRNLTLIVTVPFFIVPAIYLGFRLAFATEAVVLKERNLAAAFRSSFELTRARFERWFELTVVSVLVALAMVFVVAVCSVVFRGRDLTTWTAIAMLGYALVTPIVQYAWTFFYLRLAEGEPHAPEPGPLYADSHAATPVFTDQPSTSQSPDPLPD